MPLHRQLSLAFISIYFCAFCFSLFLWQSFERNVSQISHKCLNLEIAARRQVDLSQIYENDEAKNSNLEARPIAVSLRFGAV